jgi:hypothetical protein
VSSLALRGIPLLLRINEKLPTVPLTSTTLLFPNEHTNEKRLFSFPNKNLEGICHMGHTSRWEERGKA